MPFLNLQEQGKKGQCFGNPQTNEEEPGLLKKFVLNNKKSLNLYLSSYAFSREHALVNMIGKNTWSIIAPGSSRAHC